LNGSAFFFLKIIHFRIGHESYLFELKPNATKQMCLAFKSTFFFKKTLPENSLETITIPIIPLNFLSADRLCGLVVRVLGYRSGSPGSIPGNYQKNKKVVDLERGPLSLVSTTEELLNRESSGSCLENREYGRRDSSRWARDTLYLQKSWQSLRRQAAVARSV
jgi:hypothetical protein